MGFDDKSEGVDNLIGKLEAVYGPAKAESAEAIDEADTVESVEPASGVADDSTMRTERVRSELADLADRAVRGELTSDEEVRRRAIEIVVESKFEGKLQEETRTEVLDTLVGTLVDDETFVAKLDQMLVQASRAGDD